MIPAWIISQIKKEKKEKLEKEEKERPRLEIYIEEDFLEEKPKDKESNGEITYKIQ